MVLHFWGFCLHFPKRGFSFCLASFLTSTSPVSFSSPSVPGLPHFLCLNNCWLLFNSSVFLLRLWQLLWYFIFFFYLLPLYSCAVSNCRRSFLSLLRDRRVLSPLPYLGHFPNHMYSFTNCRRGDSSPHTSRSGLSIPITLLHWVSSGLCLYFHLLGIRHYRLHSKVWQAILCFPCAVIALLINLLSRVFSMLFHNDVVKYNLFFQEHQHRGNSSLKVFLVSSIITLCQKYVGLQKILEKAFPLDVPSNNVGSPSWSLRAADDGFELIDKDEADFRQQ